MLIKCSECGAEVSNQANKCPKCGAPTAQKKSGIAIIGAVIFFLLAFVFFGGMLAEIIVTGHSSEASLWMVIGGCIWTFIGVACLKYRKK